MGQRSCAVCFSLLSKSPKPIKLVPLRYLRSVFVGLRTVPLVQGKVVVLQSIITSFLRFSSSVICDIVTNTNVTTCQFSNNITLAWITWKWFFPKGMWPHGWKWFSLWHKLNIFWVIERQSFAHRHCINNNFIYTELLTLKKKNCYSDIIVIIFFF